MEVLRLLDVILQIFMHFNESVFILPLYEISKGVVKRLHSVAVGNKRHLEFQELPLIAKLLQSDLVAFLCCRKHLLCVFRLVCFLADGLVPIN